MNNTRLFAIGYSITTTLCFLLWKMLNHDSTLAQLASLSLISVYAGMVTISLFGGRKL